MMFELTVLLFLLCHSVESIKIAIVGGGVGGTSSAYFLKKFLPPEKLTQIDLFTNADIGGRVTTISIPFNGKDRLFEAGGSILFSHPNAYFSQWMESFGARQKDRPSSRGRMGVWNGNETVFIQSEWYLLTLYRILRRYNLDLVRNYFEIKNMLSDFGYLYDLLDQGHSFADIDAVMNVGLPTLTDLLNITSFEHLQKSGYHSAFIDEIATGNMNLDYGQTLKNTHAVVGSFVRIGSVASLYSVHGSIGSILKSLLEYSGANVIRSNIEKVSRKGESFVIIGDGGRILGDEYDYVILAVPFHQEQKIRIEDLDIDDHFGEYIKIVTTLVEGSLRESTFAVSHLETLRTILVANNDFVFTSLLEVTPVDYIKDESARLPVWMLFAKDSIPNAELQLLFEDMKHVREAPFLAYPNYGKAPRSRPRFRLANGICHVNAIEWIASTIEMGAVGARNCVNMLMHDLDIPLEKSKVKAEL